MPIYRWDMEWVELCPRYQETARMWADKHFDLPCLACRQRDYAGEHLDPERIPRGRYDVPLAPEEVRIRVTWFLQDLALCGCQMALNWGLAWLRMPPAPPGVAGESPRDALYVAMGDLHDVWLRSRR